MNNSNDNIRRRTAAWLLAAIAIAAPLLAADRKPNFLFIITDDQRWDAMGEVQREQGDKARYPWFKSPNMDRLAAGGVRFRNAFVTLSLCSPSRAAFLTGRYNHANGIIDNNTALAGNAVHLDYLRHIKGADENLGRLLDALDELKLTEDTVVVYSSDNGFFLGEHCLGDKRLLYEESLRVPMLARYPRGFGKGQVVDEMVLNIDLAPTFLDLAGVSVPPAMQGASWKDLAAGRKPAKWRTSFVAEYYRDLGDGPTCVGIRTDTAKLVKYSGHPEWTEASDLTKDPYEVKNLASDSFFTAKLETALKK